MKEIRIISLIKLYTILLLSKKPYHGYEIIKEVGENIGKKISAGEIYPFLGLLKKYEYINFKTIGERKKKIYFLTKEGRIFVKNIVNRFGDLIEIAVEPKLTVCRHCDCKIYEGGHEEEVKGKKLVFCCHHCAKSFLKEI